MNPEGVTVNISVKTIIQGLLLIALAGLLYFLRDLVLIILTAVVLASAIEPAVAWFMKYRVPRILGVILVYTITLLILFGIVFFFIPPVLDEALNFVTSLPEVIDALQLSEPLESSTFFAKTETIAQSLSVLDVLSGARDTLSNFTGGFIATVSGVFGGVASFLLILVFSFYFAVQETGVDDFLRIVSPLKHQNYILGLWKRSQIKIGRWMQGQLLLAVIVGVLVYLGLSIFGVRYALLLAIIAAVFELIPVFGSVLSAIPGVAIAFADGGVTLGFIVVGLYLVIQQFESNLIYPLVVTKVVGVPPLLVILSLIIGVELAGFLGVILSVPVAAVIQEFVSDIERDRKVRVREEKR